MVSHIILTAVIFGSIGFTIGFLMKPSPNPMKESQNA